VRGHMWDWSDGLSIGRIGRNGKTPGMTKLSGSSSKSAPLVGSWMFNILGLGPQVSVLEGGIADRRSPPDR
jgi:hypothetical protein